MPLSPCLYVSMFLEFRKWKTELMENGNLLLFLLQMEKQMFRLFAADENIKRKFVFFGRQAINGNRQFLSANVPIFALKSWKLTIAVKAYLELALLEPWRLTLELWMLTLETGMLSLEPWRLSLEPCRLTL